MCGSVELLTAEDVIPRWLFKCYERPGAGPFTMTRRPEPIFRRNGDPVTNPTLERVLLDVCEPCNAWLNKTFEVPAKKLVRGLGEAQAIAGDDVLTVARWAVKTLVLYGHPSARRSNRLHATVQRPELENGPDLAKAIRTTGAIPEDISLWISSVDADLETQGHAVHDGFWPSRTYRADGAGGPVDVVSLGFGAPLLNLTVMMTLVVHPLVDIENPWEELGLATRVWPKPPECLAIRDLPALDIDSDRRSLDWIADSGIAVHLGPSERWTPARSPFRSDEDGDPD